jgi:NAD(P)-dependent dehydrogenase (short-subunit alcohol dehydrogenase family)
MSKTIVITGASDGIGAAAARCLHQDGHEVVLVGRSPEKLAAIAGELGAESHVVDFTRLDEVRDLAATLTAAHPHIDVLANNAGGWFRARELTADGNERTFQVDHLAAFLLTNLLMPTLLASGASVIQTSSSAARQGHVDLAASESARRYSGQRAYGTAKLENILFTRQLHARFHDRGLSSAAFHPGVVRSNFGTAVPQPVRATYEWPIFNFMMASPERGAAQLVWLAEGSPGADWRSGEYYAKRKVVRTNPQAYDDALAQQLWQRSSELTGVGQAA